VLATLSDCGSASAKRDTLAARPWSLRSVGDEGQGDHGDRNSKIDQRIAQLRSTGGIQ
jgi:hypothetical protein